MKIGGRVVVGCLIGTWVLVSVASCSGRGASSGPLQIAGDSDHQCSPVGPDRTATMGDNVVSNSSNHNAQITSITMVSPTPTIQLLGVDVVTLHGYNAVGVTSQYPPDPAALRAEGITDWPSGLTHHGPWTVATPTRTSWSAYDSSHQQPPVISKPYASATRSATKPTSAQRRSARNS